MLVLHPIINAAHLPAGLLEPYMVDPESIDGKYHTNYKGTPFFPRRGKLHNFTYDAYLKLVTYHGIAPDIVTHYIRPGSKEDLNHRRILELLGLGGITMLGEHFLNLFLIGFDTFRGNLFNALFVETTIAALRQIFYATRKNIGVPTGLLTRHKGFLYNVDVKEVNDLAAIKLACLKEYGYLPYEEFRAGYSGDQFLQGPRIEEKGKILAKAGYVTMFFVHVISEATLSFGVNNLWKAVLGNGSRYGHNAANIFLRGVLTSGTKQGIFGMQVAQAMMIPNGFKGYVDFYIQKWRHQQQVNIHKGKDVAGIYRYLDHYYFAYKKPAA